MREAAGLVGLACERSRFSVSANLPTPTAGSNTDVADLIYLVHRCRLAHGGDIPPEFELFDDRPGIAIGFDPPGVRLPGTLVYGLLFITVSSREDRDVRLDNDGAALWWDPPLGAPRLPMPVNEWWGRRRDFLEVVVRYPRSSVVVRPDETSSSRASIKALVMGRDALAGESSPASAATTSSTASGNRTVITSVGAETAPTVDGTQW